MKSFALAVLATVAMAAPAEDLMGTLPNAPAFPTNTYSGYLEASETKSLHYVFAESMGDPTSDPVIVWFNGGPGCSSMLGFMQENGPRVIDDGETYIKTNPHPWNERANVMYLESPAGVGWSVGVTEEDLTTNDMITSEDALKAMHSWYEKFPEHLNTELYLSGESYAGIYVPYLAWQIYENNLKAEAHPSSVQKLPLAGMMVGNGVTDWSVDCANAMTATGVQFNIFPTDLQKEWLDLGCYFVDVVNGPAVAPEGCTKLLAKGIKLMDKLNIYDWYRKNYALSPVASQVDRLGSVEIGGEVKTYTRGHTAAEYSPFMKHYLHATETPLLGASVADYMNNADVRKAFNIPDDVQAWSDCTNAIDYTMQPEGSIWIYPILRNNIKIMIYSGDTDGCVPTYGTKMWIKELGWEVTDPWRPIHTNGQVTGYTERRDGLDFMTVKGVGHMAPQWARQPTTNMMMHWIHNEPV